MKHEFITSQSELTDLCGRLESAESIAFDTEFISERTYWPVLCLVQVAADGVLAVIDPLGIDDMAPFWRLLADERRETLVHAGREELGFCLRSIGAAPGRLFDIQIAAGLVGLEYPAGYSTLLSKLLGEKLRKGETRTDWSRRPLTDRQIRYALDDVIYLHRLRDALLEKLEQAGRTKWFTDEMNRWSKSVEAAAGEERWGRVSGASRLDRRSMAVVREVWRWREEQAKRRDMPARRVLRDDLLVELAKRRTDNPKQIALIRGMEWRDIKRAIPELAECVRRAMQLPDEELPEKIRRQPGPQLTLLGQFLATALSGICLQSQVAIGLVGSVQDVRDLVAHRLGIGHKSDRTPSLAEGWRAEIVGRAIDKLLAGETAIRIADPLSDQPLTFDPVERS